MRIIGLAGWSGAGKTTLLVQLIPELVGRGVRVSTIKHAHHAFDIDVPGKDSYEHRKAGAREVLVASANRYALVHEHLGDPEPGLGVLLRKLSPCDLVVVEGFKGASHPKIEVHRSANGKPLLAGDIPNVVAIASDATLPPMDIPIVPLDDVAAIADLALRFASPLSELAG